MKLAALQARTLPLTLDILGEPLKVEVRPNRWTSALLHSDSSIAESLPEVVEKWDLLDGDEPLPLTAEAINEHVGLPIQQLIWRGISEGLRPNSMSPTSSSDT